MRERLKEITEQNYWVYGITEHDFYHAVELVEEMIEARTEQWKSYERKVREESPHIADDILDDPAYYRYTDEQFLWTFSLWRLQGLIEAVITYQLLELTKAKRFYGFKAKLKTLRKAGFTLSDNEYDELIHWANLRNALTHAPPEVFRPVPLMETDVIEYREVLVKLYLRWIGEKDNRSEAQSRCSAPHNGTTS